MNILDANKMAIDNGIKLCLHPMDGGMVVTRLVPITEGEDPYELFTKLVETHVIRGIYQAETYDVTDVTTGRPVRQFKIRILL